MLTKSWSWHRIPNFGDPLASAERPSGGHRKPTGPDHRPMEFVFVVPREALFPAFYPHGLSPFAETAGSDSDASTFSLRQFDSAVAEHGFFVERARAETSPQWKQVIPYSLVECDGRILVVRRLRKGGESRLHEKHSIGIGGHINPEDLSGEDAERSARRPAGSDREQGARNPIDAGTRREIAEELAVRGAYDIRRVGLLNDDSNPVGAVHVGVVQVISVRGSVEIRERDQLEGRLVRPEELAEMLTRGTNFETWSGLLIPRLDEILSKPMTVAS
jgi:predicted NUDIX family phosphoesterase